MNKLEMAHEFVMSVVRNPTVTLKSGDLKIIVENSWKYADAMQAEADKQKKEEAEEASKEMASILENHKCSYLHERICWCGKIKT